MGPPRNVGASTEKVNRQVEAEHEGFSHILLDDHRWALRVAIALWAVAGSLFIAMAIAPLRDAIFTIDESIYDATYPVKIGVVTALAWTLNFIGSGIFAWPLRAAITALLVSKRRWEAVAAWLLALALSEPFIWILKGLYGRERPPQALVETVSHSFPSGHAVGGTVMAIALVIAFVPAGPGRRNLEMAAAGFALLMGASRMYLGAHYLSDVVSGVAFGATAAIGSAVVVHRVYLRRFIRERQHALESIRDRQGGLG